MLLIIIKRNLVIQILFSCIHILQFMLRQEAIKLFRDLLRTIKQIPDKESQKELRDWVRRDFELHKKYTDEVSVKMALQYGKRSLRELQTSLALSQ